VRRKAGGRKKGGKGLKSSGERENNALLSLPRSPEQGRRGERRAQQQGDYWKYRGKGKRDSRQLLYFILFETKEGGRGGEEGGGKKRGRVPHTPKKRRETDRKPSVHSFRHPHLQEGGEKKEKREGGNGRVTYLSERGGRREQR